MEEMSISDRLTSGYLNGIPTSHLKALTAWELSGQFGPAFLARCNVLESLILTNIIPEQSDLGWPSSLRYLRLHLGWNAIPFTPFGLTTNLVHVDIRSATCTVTQRFNNERPFWPEVLGSLRTFAVEALNPGERISKEYVNDIVQVVQRAPSLVALEVSAGLALDVCRRLAGIQSDAAQTLNSSTRSTTTFPAAHMKLLRIWYSSANLLKVEGLDVWRDILPNLTKVADRIEWWGNKSTKAVFDGHLGDILSNDSFASLNEDEDSVFPPRPTPSLAELFEDE